MQIGASSGRGGWPNSALVRFFLRHRAWFLGSLQSFLIMLSLLLALLLRFDFTLPRTIGLLESLPILLMIRIVCIWRFGLLHGWWRYTGVNDAVTITECSAVGSVVFYVIMHYGLRLTVFPSSVYVLEGLITTGSLTSIRLFSRALAESFYSGRRGDKRLILIGAGFAAQMILREIRRPGSGFRVLACLDDDSSKIGMKLHGISVYAKVSELRTAMVKFPADEVLIAIPSATGEQMRRIVAICEEARVRFKTVPALCELIRGEVIVNQLREVNVEDLLGRDPIQIDLESVRREIEGRSVIVTGAAGSIGSEICRQVLEYRPATLVCVDQSETGMFFLQRELERRTRITELIFTVTDIRDSDDIARIFLRHRPQIVFHAAAYKHVPLMEQNPRSAIENNIFALLSLLNVAEKADCEAFVLISSDKAVNPTSVMGATKRICELVISSRPSAMRCVSVRFGNVLGSSGSVVPVLREQLSQNVPLTVTHPDICRYFMTTREAVALVLQAFAIGNHGEILVLDMGRPVKIMDLARSLIRLSGKSEDSVRIDITGLRAGEKLREELVSEAEELLPTHCQRIARIRGARNHWEQLEQQLRELRSSLYLDGANPIRLKIMEILPEYVSLSKPRDNESIGVAAGAARQ